MSPAGEDRDHWAQNLSLHLLLSGSHFDNNFKDTHTHTHTQRELAPISWCRLENWESYNIIPVSRSLTPKTGVLQHHTCVTVLNPQDRSHDIALAWVARGSHNDRYVKDRGNMS